MTKRTVTVLIIVLAFFGIADAWYLAQAALSDTPLVCDINGLSGCNIVAQSPYSHLFGVPLALYGVFFFGLIFALAALALWISRPIIARSLTALGVLGLLASIAFILIQVVLIKATCLYCLGSAVISLLIFVLTIMHGKHSREPIIQEWEVTRIAS